MPKQSKEKDIIISIREVIRDEIQPLREEFNQKLDDILIGEDKIVKRLDTLEIEVTSISNNLSRQDKRDDKLENRVNRVEKHIGLKSLVH